MKLLKIHLTAALCCLFIASACSSAASADTPSDVVKKYYAAVNAEDYATAADCLYYDGKDVAADKQMMIEMLTTYLGPQLKAMGGLTVENLTETIGENGEAVVVFDLKSGTGNSGKEHATCLRDASGAWKMRPVR